MRKFICILVAMCITAFTTASTKADSETQEKATKFWQMLYVYHTQQETIKYFVKKIGEQKKELQRLEKMLTTDDFRGLEEQSWRIDGISVSLPIASTCRDESKEIRKFSCNINSEGFPEITETDFSFAQPDTKKRSYQIFFYTELTASFCGSNKAYKIIEKSGDSEYRIFLDIDGDSFKERFDHALHQAGFSFDTFILANEDTVIESYRFPANHRSFETPYKDDITPDKVNATLSPILDTVWDEIAKQVKETQDWREQLQEMSSGLKQEISAKRREAEQAKRTQRDRGILGLTYEPIPSKSFENFNSQSDHNRRQALLEEYKSMRSIKDLRRFLLNNPITYPREGTTEKRTALMQEYASPLTTHVRGYGVCDEQAMHVAPGLSVLVKKKVLKSAFLVSYGYQDPRTKKKSFHAIAVYQLPNKSGHERWQYFSNGIFSSKIYSSREKAIKDSAIRVGYKPTKLIQVKSKRIPTIGNWVYDDLASSKLGP